MDFFYVVLERDDFYCTHERVSAFIHTPGRHLSPSENVCKRRGTRVHSCPLVECEMPSPRGQRRLVT